MSELGNVLSRHAHIFPFIAFLVILAVFACGEASAESNDGWGTPLVIGGSPENSFDPDLDVANSGMAASAWEEWPAQAYVSIYGPGSGWSEKMALHAEREFACQKPRVEVDGYGNVIAMWSEWTGSYYHPDMQLWCRVYSTGMGWGEPFKVLEPAEDFDLCVLEDGSAFCIYTVCIEGDYGPERHIYGILYEPGPGWSSPSLIKASDAGAIESLQIEGDSLGGALAVWCQRNWTGVNHVCWAYYSYPGAWTEGQVEDYLDDDSRYPELAVNQSGDAVVTWLRGGWTEPGLYHNWFVAGSWGTPDRVVDRGEGLGGHDVAIDDDGNAIAVWAQTSEGVSHVWRAYFDGSVWSAPSLAENDELGIVHPNSYPYLGGSFDPRIAMNGEGRAVALWACDGNHYMATFADLYVPDVGWRGPEFIGHCGKDHLVALDSGGNATAVWSFFANGTMANRLAPDQGVPSAVRSLRPFVGNHSVTLQWEAPFSNGGDPIAQYNVYRFWGFEVVPLIATVPAGQTQYVDGTAVNGLWYYYSVSASNGLDEGLRYAPMEVKMEQGGVPSAPLNLTASAGRDFIQLAWDPPANSAWTYIFGYRIYRDSLPWTWGDSLTCSFTDPYLGVGVTHTYRVSAFNYDAEGPKSDPITATTNSSALSEPGYPLNLGAVARHADALLTYEVVLTWEAPMDDGGTPVTDYLIYRYEDGSSSYLGSTGSGSILSYVDTTVEMGENYLFPNSYIYSVGAVNSVGAGPITIGVSLNVPGPKIVVTSPVADDSWARGTTHFIAWELFLSAGPSVDIWLWKGGTNATVIEGAENRGLFAWDMPEDLPTGSGYQLVVFDPSLLDAVGISDEFEIVAEGVDGPLVEASLEGNLTASGWYRSAVTVTLNVTEYIPSMYAIYYRLDGGQWSTYTLPLVVAEDGEHACEYYLEVGNGTYYPGNTTEFSIDTVAPSLEILSPSDGEKFNRTSIVVVLNCSDIHSGMGQVSYRLDAGAWRAGSFTGFLLEEVGQGGHSLVVRAIDRAGIWIEQSIMLNIDLVDPAVLDHGPIGGWNGVHPIIYCVFSEPMNRTSVSLGGIDGALSWSGNNCTLAPSMPLLTAGTYSITVTGKDEYGNHLQSYAWSFQTMVTIKGKVLNRDGAPIEGAEVQLMSGEEVLKEGTTGGDGGFQLGCAFGDYTLVASSSGQRTEQEIEVGPDLANDFQLVLEEESKGWGMEMMALIIAVVVTIGLLAFVLIRRRGRL